MVQSKKYNLARYGCYMTSFTMSGVSVISPLLFVTFREMYGISYTQMGFLVVVNFLSQLIIDLVFSFFSHKFNIHKTVKAIPLVALSGFLVYAILPQLFPGAAYIWILIGTIIFSVAAGLGEVLMSPVVAAIPSDNPEREMSKLHSTYAWGVVTVVTTGTLLLKLVGRTNWMYLPVFWMLIPLTAWLLYRKAELPPMNVHSAKDGNKLKISKGLLLCTVLIFLGGAAECTMTQWMSGYIETATNVPKVYGDIFGMAFFAFMLGTGRSMYAKYGRDVIKFMHLGMIGAAVCYVVAGLSLNPVIGIAGCALTGLCTAMLWPGTLIYAEDKMPGLGVSAYALLAAGGDAGASIVPQLVGVAADGVGASSFAAGLSKTIGITAEQIGIRSGILIAALFPIAGIILIGFVRKYFKKKEVNI